MNCARCILMFADKTKMQGRSGAFGLCCRLRQSRSSISGDFSIEFGTKFVVDHWSWRSSFKGRGDGVKCSEEDFSMQRSFSDWNFGRVVVVRVGGHQTKI